MLIIVANDWVWAAPHLVMAESNIAMSFVNDIKNAADNDGVVSSSIDIDCPALNGLTVK